METLTPCVIAFLPCYLFSMPDLPSCLGLQPNGCAFRGRICLQKPTGKRGNQSYDIHFWGSLLSWVVLTEPKRWRPGV
ncbi:hypothetical protein GN956_G13805 [Arapaima gigas]